MCIKSEFQIPETGFISKATLFINLTHIFLSDLKINLTSPSGEKILVNKPRVGGVIRNSLVGFFLDIDLEGLQSKGKWNLEIEDVETIGDGDFLSLEFNLEFKS